MDTGVYSIRLAADPTLAVDVQGATKALCGNVQMWHTSDLNSQRWQVSPRTQGGNALSVLRVLHCGKYLNLAGGLFANGTNVQQFSDDGSNGMTWKIEDASSTATVNGTSYEAYHVLCYNSALALDAQGARLLADTNLQVWDWTSSSAVASAEKWIFVKDSMLDTALPVPIVGWADSATGSFNSHSTQFQMSGTASIYGACVCAGGDFQFRYRSRGRKTGTDTWGAWSTWSTPAGATTDDGWGAAWAAGFTSSNANSRQICTTAISATVDQTTYDRVQMQFEMRRFDADGSATYGATHGASGVSTIDCVYRPTVTLGTTAFSPTGLSIPVTSDFKRSGNSLHITSVRDGVHKVCGMVDATGLADSDTVDIPLSSMEYVPSDGDTLTVSYSYSTVDCTVSGTSTSLVAYDASHGTTVGASATYHADGAYYTIALAEAHTSATCWLETDGTFEECGAVDSTHFAVIPQLGDTSPMAFIAVHDGTSWATQAISLDPIASIKYAIWNYDGTYTCLKCNKGDIPSFAYGYSPDSATVQTTGREFESVFFGLGTKSDPSVSGTIIVGDSMADVADFDRLLKAHYALFRAPTGERFNVAITDIKYSDIHEEWRGVDVSMVRRS